MARQAPGGRAAREDAQGGPRGSLGRGARYQRKYWWLLVKPIEIWDLIGNSSSIPSQTLCFEKYQIDPN